MPLEPGLRSTVTQVVTPELAAPALGSGDVPVLATPALIALLERAAVQAVSGALPDGQTSVGVSVSLEHLAATRVGAEVTATSILEAVEGRRLTFAIQAADGAGAVARGTHVRVVVDRARFLQQAAGRQP